MLNYMKTKFIVLTAAFLMLTAPLFAQSSARDADIDAKMNAAALGGIAPPTGSQMAMAPAVTGGSQKFNDPYLPAAMLSGNVILGQTDGKARVYEVQGSAFILKKGSPVEKKLKKGDVINPGDTIHTETNSKVSIAFDESYKNAVHIPQNSKALIESIEPTNIRIENGSVFSAVDGLPQGSTWKVTTPTAVAAVRGTLYLVNYQSAGGQFYAATVDIPTDEKNSSIDIQQITSNGSVNVPEGNQITLKEGEKPDIKLVQKINPAMLDEILKFFADLQKLRTEEGRVAPATSGQYSGPGVLDAAGPGVIGGDDNRLDIQDLNTIRQDEPTSPLPTVTTNEGSSGGNNGKNGFPGGGATDGIFPGGNTFPGNGPPAGNPGGGPPEDSPGNGPPAGNPGDTNFPGGGATGGIFPGGDTFPGNGPPAGNPGGGPPEDSPGNGKGPK